MDVILCTGSCPYDGMEMEYSDDDTSDAQNRTGGIDDIVDYLPAPFSFVTFDSSHPPPELAALDAEDLSDNDNHSLTDNTIRSKEYTAFQRSKDAGMLESFWEALMNMCGFSVSVYTHVQKRSAWV